MSWDFFLCWARADFKVLVWVMPGLRGEGPSLGANNEIWEAECRGVRAALAWYGTVWCGVVWLALQRETIPSPLAPCASVRTFMRGAFVPGRQAHQ